ncbi:calmodulin [Brachionus plicatilis]|uniref:Calmodulin n=1 Tax=Brachionus plicatilis TaxID=10195 RepID=A0A3M7R1F7_BRAPC|nr:calmodulin [Brachionus plicatilis]
MSRDLVQEAAGRAKNLQVEQIKTIKEAFDQFDVNGDGTVSINEVDKVLDTLSIHIPESEQERIIQTLDKNGNGTIEFVEFVINYENGLFNF